jgi:HEAT repeat protein
MTVEELENDLINNPDADIRRSAAEGLANLDYMDQSIIQALAQGIIDSDSGVKDICSRALSMPDDQYAEAVAMAVVPFIAHRDIETRNLASDTLKKIGPPAINSLLEYIIVDDIDIRQFAVEILGGIGDAIAVPYILPLLEDINSNVRNATIEAIGNLQSQASVISLIDIYSKEEELKPTIIESLGKIGGNTAEEFLIDKLRNEKDLLLKTAVIDALSYTGEDISICHKLLEELPTTLPDLQVVLLKTIYAIAFRLDVAIELPADLRYVAHKSLADEDIDLRSAGLVALGSYYILEDVPFLVTEILRNHSDLQQMILISLLSTADQETVGELFQTYCTRCNRDLKHLEFFSMLPLIWEYASDENKIICVEKNTELLFNPESGYSLEVLEILISLGMETVISTMTRLAEIGEYVSCDLMLDAVSEYARYEFLPVLEIISEQENEIGERAKAILSEIA